MSSELRKRKYQFLFERYWDHNKDGCVDKKDVDILIAKTCKVKGWAPGTPEYEKVKITLYKILDNMMEQLGVNKDGKITLEEWTTIFEECFKTHKEPKEWVELYEDFVYDVLRSYVTDNTITLDEYVKVITMFGATEEDAKKSFEKSTSGKAAITKDEFVQLWREYCTTDDPYAPGNELCCR